MAPASAQLQGSPWVFGVLVLSMLSQVQVTAFTKDLKWFPHDDGTQGQVRRWKLHVPRAPALLDLCV